jgi:hypothetical protein
MGYYLLDHPNPNGNHFYTTRRGTIKGQIIHITAGLQDTDLRGPDSTAEGEARYAATTAREVSWHSGSDTDSYVKLLPYSYTAFQCINYNSTTAGHEISKLEVNWADDDPEYVKALLTQAADCIRPDMLSNGIPFRKATKHELDLAIQNNSSPVGMIGHHELDPTRRSDPGWVTAEKDTFPWDQFISILKQDTNVELPQFKGEGMLIQAQKGIVFVVGDQRYTLRNMDQFRELKAQGVPFYNLTSSVLDELGTRVLEGTPIIN